MKLVARALVAAAAAMLVPAALAQPAATGLKEGQATGTLVVKGKSIKLAHAYVFVDEKDSRKPVILYLTDKPVPADTWKSDFDIMRYRGSNKLNGIGFWLNPKDKYDDFRNEVCAECDSPTGTSGIFKVKFDGTPGKTFAGKITVGSSSSMAKDYQLDGAFNAKLK